MWEIFMPHPVDSAFPFWIWNR